VPIDVGATFGVCEVAVVVAGLAVQVAIVSGVVVWWVCLIGLAVVGFGVGVRAV
jgi:hypothetical protein